MKLIRSSTIAMSLNLLLKGQLKFLSESFEVVGIASKGKMLDEVQEREGIRTIGLEMERGISPFKDLSSLFKLIKILIDEKPLIVHSITPKAGLLTMLAGKIAGIPIRIHTFTGLIFPTRTGIAKKILIKTDQLLCWSATNVYPEGKGVMNDLINYKITSKPLKILGNGNVNGIDLDFFSPNQISIDKVSSLKIDLEIQDSDFVFVFVGRLVGDKGINELVAAFSILELTNVKLLLVGPQEESDPLKFETIQELKNNKNIISVGFQFDVRPYYAVSDALVFPSYREGFPNVVMQAGAMGLPSIVTDINGCNEIIEDGKNGTIISVKNVKSIKLAMLSFIENKQYFDKLKENSRIMIAERYEQLVVWNAILKEYHKLIEEYKTKE